MKIIGIVAEYNPFHNGHAYQIEQAKKIHNADACVVIMSGDYVQRGEPALLDKFTRAKMALKNGADLIIELPVLFSTGSAEIFSYGAVSILHSLGCIDELVFGAEANDLSLLQKIAAIQYEESELYQKVLKDSLKDGNSFPKALATAVHAVLNEVNIEDINMDDINIEDILQKPNNILAIQYLKALLFFHSSIKPVLVQRVGSDYHNDSLSNDRYSSATAIRSALLKKSLKKESKIPYEELKIPESVYTILQEKIKEQELVSPDDLSFALHTRLLMEYSDGYTKYLDVTEELSNKIKKQLVHFQSFSQFSDLLKSKDMTYSRISRCLLHIYLGLKQNLFDEIKQNGYSLYARPLGFTRKGKEIFSQIQKNSSVPLISKLANATNTLDLFYQKKENTFATDSQIVLNNSSTKATEQKFILAQTLLETDLVAASLYDAILVSKTGKQGLSEYTKKLIIL